MRQQQTPDTVVLIHGLYLTPRGWEQWIDRYENKGYRVMAPAWPGLEPEVEALRRDPSPIASQDVATILDHYERIIRALPIPPIIMGHSFGGAFTQVLLDRGLGAAGVAIDSAPVRGIRDLPWSTLKANIAVLRNPLRRHRAVALTADQFNYGFTNMFPPEKARGTYERYAIPGSRNVLFTGAYCNFNPRTPLRVDFRRDDRAPLLFIGGGADHVVPASVNRHNVAKYERSRSVIGYREFEGRSHFTMAQDGWEEIADFALSWVMKQTSPPADRAASEPAAEPVAAGAR